MFLAGEYTDGDKVSKSRSILKILLCGVAIAFIIMALAFFFRGFSFPRSLIFIGFFIQVILLIPIRILFRKMSRKAIYNNILVIGSEEEKDWLFKKAMMTKLPNEKVKGYYIVTGLSTELVDIIQSYTKAFISDNALKVLTDAELSSFSENNMEIVIIPRKYEISVWGAILVPLDDSIAMNIKSFGLPFEARMLKRMFDVFCSVFFIILSAPIMLCVALAIFLEDRRSPFFFQERVTIDNKKFKLIKFRSMKVDAEDSTGAVWAANDDHRITKVGKIIRAMWLDELPQFFNVLKGDMSIVGPRPERPELIAEFVKATPEFKYRTKVKAGITGYAQVLTNYGTLPENKLKLDLLYIRRWSFIFDLLIMIETVRMILMKLLGLIFKAKEPTEIKVSEKRKNNYIEYN